MQKLHVTIITLLVILTMTEFGYAQGELPTMTVTEVPPTEGDNEAYLGNRKPLLRSPLIKLPAGTIQPRGWLRTQLECMADGYTGRLPELSKWCQFEESAWASADGKGKFGWEELPYWLKGYIALGYALDDERIISEAEKWIEAVLSSQQEDGYFGPRVNKRKHDLWPNMIMLDALRTFYEATGDDRVIPFMLNYCRWLQTIPLEHFLPGSWQKQRAGDLLHTVYWLYNHTGENWLLDVARLVHERTADWSGGMASWHGVNIAQCFREPAQYYQQSHDRRYLRAAYRNYSLVMNRYGQVPGGMFGADENCRPGYTGPGQASETCAMVEMMRSCDILARISGEVVWADRCEDVAFNSLPASMPPDLKSLHYLTAPNMVQLDRNSKAPFLQNSGCMLAYDPRRYRCCQHNAGQGWPYFAESLWAATAGDGLAAMLYAPCELRAKAGGENVRITENTDYPFGETVKMTVHMDEPAEFPLTLRIPGWCSNASVAVNGERLDGDPKPSQFTIIDRNWHDGDEITLVLVMKLRIKRWEKQGNGCSVHYGPLGFSLKIGAEWKAYWREGNWTAWEVFPTTPWNYGLKLDAAAPVEALEIERSTGLLAEQPFAAENAPIVIRAKGKQIPQWRAMQGIVAPLQASPVQSDEPIENLTLIPMGCARLRVSLLPVVMEGVDGHEWEVPKIQPAASHIHDSVRAICDGVEPDDSNDQSIPRFTWWPHKGTQEWVQYTFREPRRVSQCAVYWFDDRNQPGYCRVPLSWRILYDVVGEWKEVSNASGYGVERNRFNVCTFDPVTTNKLRLEVRLPEGFSGGILEWRVDDGANE